MSQSQTGSLLPLHEHQNKIDVLDHLSQVNNQLYFYGQEVCINYAASTISDMITQLWIDLEKVTSGK